MVSTAPTVFFVTLVDLGVLDITPNQNSRLTKSFIVFSLLRPKTLISKSPVNGNFYFPGGLLLKYFEIRLEIFI